MSAPPLHRKAVRLPAVDLLALLGTFLVTLGLLGSGARYLLAGGAVLALALVLFWDEGRWSQELVRQEATLPPGGSPSPPTGGAGTSPLPWWKRPKVYPGKWLCTSCGWREDEHAVRCPRCGKPLVRLLSGANVKS